MISAYGEYIGLHAAVNLVDVRGPVLGLLKWYVTDCPEQKTKFCCRGIHRRVMYSCHRS